MNARWLKYLPRFLRAHIEGRFGLQAALANGGWLFADKILRMGAGLLVGVWIARYLGPEQFGLWNYAIAFTALFGSFATLGLDGIVVRELVKYPEYEMELLGSALALKFFAGAITMLVAVLAISQVRHGEPLTMWLVGLSAAAYIFQSMNVIDFYFQAKVQSKYTVFASNASFVLTTIVKIVLLMNAAPLIAFAWAGLVEVILATFFLWIAYSEKNHNMRDWRYEWHVVHKLIKYSWPLILSGIAVIIYMRIDQIMIGQMLGDKEVGIFSAAVRISEVWYFIPMIVVSSAFPAVMAAKAQSEELYLSRIQRLYDMMAWLGISVALVTTFLAPYVVYLLYGDNYSESATVLSIQIWAGIGVCMSYVHGRWLLIENLQKYNLMYTALGAILNVAFNFFLIPTYGVIGAAIATLIAQLSLMPVQCIFRDARPNFYLMMNSFMAPYRWSIFFLKSRY